jgi:FAD/FMN-containing dehydrogenase
MEYAVPIESFQSVVQEIQAEIKNNHHRVHFPIECRFVKKDSIWLSPAYGRDSALIAVHMYRGMPYRGYFNAIEKIFRKYDGRPHWGKLHSLGAEDLQSIYPRWDEFQELRAEMDPQGIFLTEIMQQIFRNSETLRLSDQSA